MYYEFDSEDRPLGEGGMGKVFKGSCVEEGSGQRRDVAIKFLYSDLPQYAVEKARREAGIRFRHDNLVEMLGFIETEGRSVLGEPERRYHVVSELLEGVSLDHVLAGRLVDQWGNAVPRASQLYNYFTSGDIMRFAVVIARDVLSGLQMMHDQGYIHRDIDPTNIMITGDGRIKLIDFGIAKKMNALTTSDKHLTQAGQFVGKPEYAAPELVMGAINEQNQTTDLYAVGVLLFQCVVGHPPFEGDRVEVMQSQPAQASAAAPGERPRSDSAVIAKATRKQRAERYQSAAEFRVALDRLSERRGMPSFAWRRPYTWAAAGVLSVCALAAVVLAWPEAEPEAKPAPRPVSVTMTYGDALAGLLTKSKAGDALRRLKELSGMGDGRATYLLSRLYFKSRMADEEMADSIVRLRSAAGIQPDNRYAHAMLEKAVGQDAKNHHALMDLALDYWKAGQRTEAVEKLGRRQGGAILPARAGLRPPDG